MNFDLSEEQELFTSTVDRFTQSIDVEARHQLRGQDGGYDKARWAELAELGLIALAADENSGGMGGSPLDLALVSEALGRNIAPDPWLDNGVLPARLLAAAGSDELLESVLSGEKFAAFAWAERNQRYSLSAKQTKLGGQAITGEKSFVMGAALADVFIVSVDDGGSNGFYLLPKDSPGLDIRQYRLADGSIAGELRFNSVAVSDADRLDISEAELATIVSDARLLASAELVGLGQRLLNDTKTYVKEREQFGVPIGSFQALQHRLVDCYAKIEQARSMLYRAALQDRTDDAACHRGAAGAKAYIGEAVDHVAREAVQLHGGMGVTDELSIGHAMKRVLLLNRLFGDIDTSLEEYARAA
ncbi:MAG: acyl-CoA dehydrogenase family protein [Erythrobacter sp.]